MGIEQFPKDPMARGSVDTTEAATEEIDGDELLCQECDEPPIRSSKCPGAPTEQQKEDHYRSHIPFRSWCPVCVKAKGREDMHIKGNTVGGKATISLDSKLFAELPDQENITAIVMKDEESKAPFIHYCIQKGAQDEWIVRKILEDIENLGHGEIILKTDGEPAIVQLLEQN